MSWKTTIKEDTKGSSWKDTIKEDDGESSDISMLESGLEGAKQGATFGLADEASGVLGAGLEGARDVKRSVMGEQLVDEVPGEGKLERLKRLYTEYRDVARDKSKAAEEANPGSFMAGDLAASVVTPGLAVKGVKGTANVVKNAVKAGAATGALEGFGRSEADNALDLAEDTAQGGILGIGAGYVGGKVAQKFGKEGTEKALQKAKDETNIEALKSIGANKADFQKEFGAKTSARAGVDKARGTGQTLVDEDLVKFKQNPIELNRNINTKLDETWQQGVVPTAQKLDQEIASKVTPEIINQEIQTLATGLDNHAQKLAQANRYNPSGSESLLKNIKDTSANLVNDLRNPNSAERLSHAIETKKNLNALLNGSDWDKAEVSGAKEYLKNTISELDGYINRLGTHASPELSEELANKMGTYGNLSDAQKISVKSLSKEATAFGAPTFSEALIGGAAGLGIDAGTGLGVIAAKRGVEAYAGKSVPEIYSTFKALRANSKQGKLTQKLGKFASGAIQDPDMVKAGAQTAGAVNALGLDETYNKSKEMSSLAESASPEQLREQAQNIRQQYGAAGEQLAGKLDKLPERDRIGKKALMFSILQDPKNRKMLGLDDK